MSSSVLPSSRLTSIWPSIRAPLLSLAFLAACLHQGALGALVRNVVVDAFTAVASFVAATLVVIYGAERVSGVDLGHLLARSRRMQVPIAALLGATPGCGGAVAVVAAHASGRVGFGALVAALTATMGDAAFLLIASRPSVAAVLLPASFTIGVAWGWMLDGLGIEIAPAKRPHMPARIGAPRPRHLAFLGFLAVGLVCGVADLVGSPLPAGLVSGVSLLGAAAGAWVWATSPNEAMCSPDDPATTRAAEETAFVGFWVLGAFLLYELAVAYAGLELEPLFRAHGPWLPLIAILVGFIPGCGPQILVTTLFLNGVVPFGALMGNAIANDGDALFPAIALDRRAALWATVYTAVPALVMGYACWLWVPL